MAPFLCSVGLITEVVKGRDRGKGEKRKRCREDSKRDVRFYTDANFSLSKL
jgi:hypothetical protein